MVAFGSVNPVTNPTAFTGNTTTTPPVPYPAGIAAGDILLMALANSAPGFGYATPSGWTLRQDNPNIGIVGAYAVFSAVATGSETGSLSVTVGGSGAATNALMLRYNGTSGVATSVKAEATTGTTSPVPGTLSPAPGASDLVVRFYIYIGSNNVTTTACTDSGGTWVTRMNVRTTNASDGNSGISVCDKVQGTDSQTVTGNQNGVWGVVSLTLTNSAVTPFVSNKIIVPNSAVMRAANY